jgi:ribosomal protein S18 acetylase RimI-like enzyme
MRDAHGETWRLRPGRVEDHADFTRLFGELGLEDPPPPLDMWVSGLVKHSYFVDGPEGPRAYALIDVMGDTGHVSSLVVAPGQRGLGVGRWVMERLAELLRARGCRQWRLYVKPDNAPAVALYSSLGMKPGRLERTWCLSRGHVSALPLAPEELEVVPVAEADFAPLTEAFGLVPGKLASYATQPMHRLRRLAHPEQPDAGRLGMMDLRPHPGLVFPFFAATPAHARALLEAAFREVGSARELRLVTGDEPLQALLRAAGARLVLETLEMRGPLPE